MKRMVSIILMAVTILMELSAKTIRTPAQTFYVDELEQDRVEVAYVVEGKEVLVLKFRGGVSDLGEVILVCDALVTCETGITDIVWNVVTPSSDKLLLEYLEEVYPQFNCWIAPAPSSCRLYAYVRQNGIWYLVY